MLCASSLFPTPSDGRGRKGKKKIELDRGRARRKGQHSRHGRHQAGGRGTHFTAYVSRSPPSRSSSSPSAIQPLSLPILHNCQKVINLRRRPLFLSLSVSIVKLCALCPRPFLPLHARRCLPSSAFISCMVVAEIPRQQRCCPCCYAEGHNPINIHAVQGAMLI